MNPSKFDHDIPNLDSQAIEVKATAYKEQIDTIRTAISQAIKIYQLGGRPQTSIETLKAMLVLAQTKLEILFDDWMPPNL